jgi:hypothetical protein
MKNKQILFIFANIWLIVSLTLPVDRAFDSMIALVMGLICLYKSTQERKK